MAPIVITTLPQGVFMSGDMNINPNLPSHIPPITPKTPAPTSADAASSAPVTSQQLQEDEYGIYVALAAITNTPGGIYPTPQEMYPLADSINQFCTDYDSYTAAGGSPTPAEQAVNNLLTNPDLGYRGNSIATISANVMNPPAGTTSEGWEEDLTKCYGPDSPVTGLWQLCQLMNGINPQPGNSNESLPPNVLTDANALYSTWLQINPNTINPTNPNNILLTLANQIGTLNTALEQSTPPMNATTQALYDALNAPLDQDGDTLVSDAAAVVANPDQANLETFSMDVSQDGNYIKTMLQISTGVMPTKIDMDPS